MFMVGHNSDRPHGSDRQEYDTGVPEVYLRTITLCFVLLRNDGDLCPTFD